MKINPVSFDTVPITQPLKSKRVFVQFSAASINVAKVFGAGTCQTVLVDLSLAALTDQ